MPHHHVDNGAVAGIIGAEANNSTGISGVVWNKNNATNIFHMVQSLWIPTKISQDDFDYSGAIRRAIRYAVIS